MKRGQLVGIFILMFLFSISFVFPLVSAEANGPLKAVADFINEFIKNASPVLEQILGKSYPITVGENEFVFSAGELLFAKLLFLIIILTIVWSAVSIIPFFDNNRWVSGIVSIIVAILATRWISYKLIPVIILPYSTLGIAIAAGLPFIIYFAAVEIKLSGSEYKTIRKIAWVLFAVVFFFLWILRYEVLQNVDDAKYAIWIYPITALASLAVLSFDGTFQKIWSRIKTEKATSYQNQEEIYALEDKKRGKVKRFAEGGYEGHGEEKQYTKEIEAINKRIAGLEGH